MSDASNSICTRCGLAILAAGTKTCGHCRADLCEECWERFGSCGHDQAASKDALREAARAVSLSAKPIYLPDHQRGHFVPYNLIGALAAALEGKEASDAES